VECVLATNAIFEKLGSTKSKHPGSHPRSNSSPDWTMLIWCFFKFCWTNFASIKKTSTMFNNCWTLHQYITVEDGNDNKEHRRRSTRNGVRIVHMRDILWAAEIGLIGLQFLQDSSASFFSFLTLELTLRYGACPSNSLLFYTKPIGWVHSPCSRTVYPSYWLGRYLAGCRVACTGSLRHFCPNASEYKWLVKSTHK
jgi:hypothetical protein